MITSSPITPARKVFVSTFTGPASYSQSTLMDIDLTATFEQVDFLDMDLTTQGANLPSSHQLDYALNTVGGGTLGASPGHCAVRINLRQFNKITKLIDETNTAKLSNLPAGVTAFASIQNTAAGSSHAHSMDHTHGAINSQSENTTANGVTAAVGGVNELGHSHSFTLPLITVNTGSETTHVHSDAHLYDHFHTFTTIATNVTNTQASNGTDFSDCVWTIMAVGQ